jgi:hypothetical protein
MVDGGDLSRGTHQRVVLEELGRGGQVVVQHGARLLANALVDVERDGLGVVVPREISHDLNLLVPAREG